VTPVDTSRTATTVVAARITSTAIRTGRPARDVRSANHTVTTDTTATSGAAHDSSNATASEYVTTIRSNTSP